MTRKNDLARIDAAVALDSSAVANLHAVRYGVSVENVWSSALHGYSAVIPNDRVAAHFQGGRNQKKCQDGEILCRVHRSMN